MKRLLCCLALVAAQIPAQAIRPNAGFRSASIARNDDGSGPLVPLGFTINFFGRERAQGWVNNNGNITFDSPLATYTPFGLESTRREIVAAFFADVDTRPNGSALVTYGQDTVDGHKAFGANYINVGYFQEHADKLNSFQIVIIERDDTGPGNFDLEFNYQKIVWETGDASGGLNGFGGIPASVGWSNGSGATGTSFELAGSLVSGSFLDSGRYSLARGRLNSTVQGRFVFRARAGQLRPPLTITTGCPLPPANAGQTYLVPVAAVGGGTRHTWSLQADPGTSGLPVGLALSNDGVINGRAEGPGTHEFTLRVTSATEDGEEAAVRRCGITVTPASVSITTACPLPGGTVGQPYRRTLQASGGRAPYQWSLAEGPPLPDGLALDANGTLSGLPTTAGTRVLQFRVTSNPLDGADPATKSCALPISPSVQAIQQTACALPSATVGVPYSHVLDGGDVSGRWLALDGMPSGLALTPDGRLEGVPTMSGESRLRLRFTGANASGERSCTVSITEPALRIGAACPLPSGRTGQPYRHQFAVNGGEGAYTWSSAGALPPGLTLSSSGTLEGIPDASGNHAFRLLVSDSAGRVAAAGCNVTVLRSSFAISSCPLPDATAGVDYSRVLNVEGGVAPYVFTLTGDLPAGLALTSAGRIAGRPAEAGTWMPQIRVTDRNGSTVAQRCRLAVAGSPIRMTTACPLPAASVAVPYVQRLEAVGGLPPYLWRSTGPLPAGMELTADGTLRGTPLAPQHSAFSIDVTDSARTGTSVRCSVEAKLPELPLVKLSAVQGLVQPATAGPTIAVELTRPYLLPVTGSLVLEPEPETGASDPSINQSDPVLRFRNGQRSVAFTIAPGQTSTEATIVSTGTVAGRATLRATALKAGGVTIPLSPAPRQFRIPRTPPVLTGACLTSSEIRLEGYTTTRALSELHIEQLDSIALDAGARSYFSSEESVGTGGAFSLAVPMPATGRTVQAGTNVTVANAEGTSAPRRLEACR